MVVNFLHWWRRRRSILFFAVMAVMAAGLFYLMRGLVFSFVLAAFITYLLNPLVNAIEKRGAPRTSAILMAYLALFIFVAGVFMYGMPRIIEQLNVLAETLPVYTGRAREIIDSIQARYTGLGIPDGVRQIIDEWVSSLEGGIMHLLKEAVAALIGMAGYIFKILLAPVLAFYFLKDFDLIKRKITMFIPESYREEVFELFREIDKVLGSFIKGYILVAALVGGLSAIAMAVLGVEFALMLGLFAGLTELIPYFGPVIGAVPAVGLAALKSKWLAVKVAIAFFVIHQLEGNIISPKILGNKVGLHPLVIIFSLLAGEKLYGLTGMLLAVPAAAVFRVVLNYTYRKIVFRP
ncbi:MAG: AI-2E family transporter [Pelotomaculum sp.]|nr:AI-2E family transporter [Pelotomaculum sp.]